MTDREQGAEQATRSFGARLLSAITHSGPGYNPPLRDQHADQAAMALAEVRRLCEMTIACSVRTDAINQARDTLAVIDRVMGHDRATPDREQGEERQGAAS